MMQTFDILCQLQIKHSYYKNQCKDLHIKPSQFTSDLMVRNDILLRQSAGNYSLGIASKRGENVSIQDTVSDHFSLLFLVDTSNIYLDNISNFPTRNPREVLLFSNIDVPFSEENTYQLSPGKLVTLCEKSLTIHSDEWIDNTVSNCFGAAIKPVYNERNNVVTLNISDLDEGIYRIETKKGTLYFANIPLGFREKPLALLHICANESLLKNRICQQPHYSISMDALSACWQYIFPSEKIKKYNVETLFVEANGPSIKFIQDSSMISDGYISFISASPILLEDKKEVRFRLKKSNGLDIQDSIIIPDLPLPNQETLIQRNKDPMVTPIYVKI